PPHASSTARSSASVPRSASPPRSSTRAARWVCGSSPPRSTWCAARARSVPDQVAGRWGAPVIRPPRADELERLRAIESAAGRAFLDVGMPEVAADEPPRLDTLERYRTAGWAWVITAGTPDQVASVTGTARAEEVAGYVIVDVLD